MTLPTALGVQLGINGTGPFGRRPEEDLPGVLAILAELGYDGAETHPNAWYAGAAGVHAAFSAAGLALAGVHVFEAEVDSAQRRARLVDEAAAAGCPRIIVSAPGEHGAAEYRRLAATLGLLAAEADRCGITTWYHPHDADYRSLPGGRGLDLVRDGTDPALVRFNIDVYWAHVGGADPVRVIGELAGRAGYYHVKDGDPRRSSPLGEGEVAVAASLAAMAGADWVVYEDPKPRLPPTALCRKAKDYLGRHGFTGRRTAR